MLPIWEAQVQYFFFFLERTTLISTGLIVVCSLGTSLMVLR